RVTARYAGRSQTQEVLSQSSFYSVNDFRLHFGLGAAENADLTVRWPSGAAQTFPAVRGGRLVTIKEGEKTFSEQLFREKNGGR
ncbi:MAG TPA: ASPIC/UnbV domain-containing protein, partial [Bryobacteraceae bacterium]|nr:ASPIC/UnbV domain-containing protein [Bryobacteraceae bacterium]